MDQRKAAFADHAGHGAHRAEVEPRTHGQRHQGRRLRASRGRELAILQADECHVVAMLGQPQRHQVLRPLCAGIVLAVDHVQHPSTLARGRRATLAARAWLCRRIGICGRGQGFAGIRLSRHRGVYILSLSRASTNSAGGSGNFGAAGAGRSPTAANGPACVPRRLPASVRRLTIAHRRQREPHRLSSHKASPPTYDRRGDHCFAEEPPCDVHPIQHRVFDSVRAVHAGPFARARAWQIRAWP